MEIRVRHVLDGPVDTRRWRRGIIAATIGHSQVHRFICLQIFAHVKCKPDEAAGIGRALAVELGADIGFDDTRAKAPMHDRITWTVAGPRLRQTAPLFLIRQLNRKAIAAVPMLTRDLHQVVDDGSRDIRFSSGADWHDGSGGGDCTKRLDYAATVNGPGIHRRLSAPRAGEPPPSSLRGGKSGSACRLQWCEHRSTSA